MQIVLYRRRLSLTSGAGQLIQMHARGLSAAGHRVQIAALRGGLRFFLITGRRPRRYTRAGLRRISASPDHLLVDHGAEIAEADLVFVHNLMSEGVRYVKRRDWLDDAARESAFFKALNVHAPIVANSGLVKRALSEHFDLDPQRIVVHYPGFDSRRFRAGSGRQASEVEVNIGTKGLRQQSRAALGLTEDQPLIGFVTSGELDKRGLDIFLQAAGRISKAREDARFLVVGAKRLPAWAADHPFASTGRLTYRPRGTRPERWFAALDVFLFPARFEEFGMVVSEAQACGVPVLTSRRVGASECLPPEYERWTIDAPDVDAFVTNALALLDDDTARNRLAAAGTASVARFDDDSYARRAVETTLQCAADKATRLREGSRRSGARDDESRP